MAKVPLLGDIPLIGNLFKSTADKKEKRNLMVFIRPTILRGTVWRQTACRSANITICAPNRSIVMSKV